MSNFKPLKADQFRELTEKGFVAIDFRPQQEFRNEYIPGSIYFSGSEEETDLLKKTLKKDQSLLIISGNEDEKTNLKTLNELGFKNIAGWLEGGFSAWQAAGYPTDVVVSIDTEELLLDIKFGSPMVVDIRSEDEYEIEHLENADHFPADELLAKIGQLPSDKIYYLYCEEGELSTFVISVLKRNNLHNFYHLEGGYYALKNAGAAMAGI